MNLKYKYIFKCIKIYSLKGNAIAVNVTLQNGNWKKKEKKYYPSTVDFIDRTCGNTSPSWTSHQTGCYRSVMKAFTAVCPARIAAAEETIDATTVAVNPNRYTIRYREARSTPSVSLHVENPRCKCTRSSLELSLWRQRRRSWRAGVKSMEKAKSPFNPLQSKSPLLFRRLPFHSLIRLPPSPSRW